MTSPRALWRRAGRNGAGSRGICGDLGWEIDKQPHINIYEQIFSRFRYMNILPMIYEDIWRYLKNYMKIYEELYEDIWRYMKIYEDDGSVWAWRIHPKNGHFKHDERSNFGGTFVIPAASWYSMPGRSISPADIVVDIVDIVDISMPNDGGYSGPPSYPSSINGGSTFLNVASLILYL